MDVTSEQLYQMQDEEYLTFLESFICPYEARDCYDEAETWDEAIAMAIAEALTLPREFIADFFELV